MIDDQDAREQRIIDLALAFDVLVRSEGHGASIAVVLDGGPQQSLFRTLAGRGWKAASSARSMRLDGRIIDVVLIRSDVLGRMFDLAWVVGDCSSDLLVATASRMKGSGGLLRDDDLLRLANERPDWRPTELLPEDLYTD